MGSLFFVLLVLLSWRIYRAFMRSGNAPPLRMPEDWEAILNDHVSFYADLSPTRKTQFRERVMQFLSKVRITGVSTQVNDEDRLFVASSAVIPIFGFEHWEYRGLREVLLYPQAFDREFAISGQGRTILGQVGGGVMGGKMILSRPALRQGFMNETSKTNVGIHEFVHLLDNADGLVDGIPAALLEKQYAIPWVKLMQEKIAGITSGRSDIAAYGGTENAEFFPVVSEYFFKRPDLLKRKHPQLYAKLERIFRQDPAGFS